MADKRLIQSLFKLTGLLIGAAGLIFLLVAAVRIRSEQVCTGVIISFKGSAAGRYVGTTEVARQMWPGGIPSLKGLPLDDLNLSLMERRIEQDPWVRNAELFIDANDRLQVEVEEQQPLARLFNREGVSFYIDETMRRIPLNRHFTPNLPVFTGLPVSLTGKRKEDSTCLAEVLEIALAMREDTLWMAQIEECAYEPPKGFVMYPMVGDHKIVFGGSERAREKFRNLFVFYTQVLAREGWTTYKSIDLRFARQVVAIPTVPGSGVADSLKAFVPPVAIPQDQEPDVENTPGKPLTVKQEPSVNRNTKTPRLVMPSRQRSP